MVKKREPVYQAKWAGPKDFDEVLISPVMIQDHMPDNMLKALNKVSEQALLAQGKNNCHVASTKPGSYEPLHKTPILAEDQENENVSNFGNGDVVINQLEHSLEDDVSGKQFVVDVEVHQKMDSNWRNNSFLFFY